MLEKFRLAKAPEIAQLQTLKAEGKMPAPLQGTRPSFSEALRKKAPRAVIAEYKRASPTLGNINLDLAPEAVANAYAQAGTGAISVLTERDYFKGELNYLTRMADAWLPLLRKDFILHPLQIEETAATPAAAVLLIVRMLDDDMLATLLALCAEYGIESVTEVFDREDLARAQAARAPIIQVNNRDLDTLTIDLATSKRLVTDKQSGEFWISASGIATHEQLTAYLDHGFDAALIGSSLMNSGNPGKQLFTLLHGDA